MAQYNKNSALTKCRFDTLFDGNCEEDKAVEQELQNDSEASFGTSCQGSNDPDSDDLQEIRIIELVIFLANYVL